MPRGIYTDFECDNQGHSPFTPTAHQLATLDYFKNVTGKTNEYKGLLLYHKLGSGKTCTSLLIADMMLRKRRVDHVYILTPGSLRKGWITEYCEVCGYKPKYLKRYFTFITYNYMVGRNLPNFNNSLVIIDEVHNLINGAKNQSFHPTQVYNTLLKSNCKIIALSGTPIFNYVYEWPLLGNLLKPGGFPEIRINKDQLDDYAFMKLFDIDEKTGKLTPKNPTKVKNLLKGIVSYFPGSGSEFYPEVRYMEPIKAVMPFAQEHNYWVQQEQELKLSRPPSKRLLKSDPKWYEELQKLYIMARKNILTRLASNFYYPKPYRRMKDALAIDGGWIDRVNFEDQKLLKEYSAKISVLLLNLILHNKQKHVVFTFFKDKAGVNLIHTLLDMCGISYGISSAIFSGDLDDSKRKRLLNRFNSRENRYGNLIRVLLVTEAGAEGITIKEARHMHILESSPRESRIQQAIGRIVRYKSHYELPKNEQKVQIWRYWSVASPRDFILRTQVALPNGNKEDVVKTITDKETIDEILYEKGQKTKEAVQSFLTLLQKVSVTPYQK